MVRLDPSTQNLFISISSSWPSLTHLRPSSRPIPHTQPLFQMMALAAVAQTPYPISIHIHRITVMMTTAMMTLRPCDQYHLCHMMRCVVNRVTCFPCCARCACSARSLRFLRFLHLLRFLRPPLSLYPQRLQCSLRPLSSLRPLWLLPNTKTPSHTDVATHTTLLTPYSIIPRICRMWKRTITGRAMGLLTLTTTAMTMTEWKTSR